MQNFDFLKATRFWAMVLGAVIYYLKVKGFIGDAEMVLIETILAGFVTVKTVDRASEFIGGAREVGDK